MHIPSPKRLNDRGSASIQIMIIMPIVMTMLMTIIQLAMYYHAEHVTAAAAAQAVATAGADGGSRDDGRAEAERILHDTATGLLQHPTIDVQRDGDQAVVHISGQVTSLVPFLHLTATATARGPVETITGTTK